jgi:hypothetical protein
METRAYDTGIDMNPPIISPTNVPNRALQNELLCLEAFCAMVAPRAAPIVVPFLVQNLVDAPCEHVELK